MKNRHNKATNICHVCAKEIYDNNSFEKHVRQHFETGGPKVKCPRDDCNSWLKDEYNLKLHLRRYHDPRQYECPECGRLCKNRHALSGHIYSTHSKKVFTCEACNKGFKSQQSLKVYKCCRSFCTNIN